jgi:anti-sigma-K factor RskA
MSTWPISPVAVVLGALDPGEQTQADALLHDDPLFRAEVERVRRTEAVLRSLEPAAWRPEAPPPLDGDRALTLRPPLDERAPTRRRPRLRRVPALGAAAAIAAACVVAIVLSHGDDDAPTPGELHAALALRAVAPAGAGGQGGLTIDGDRARLRVTGLRPNHDDYYEAWLADRGGHMVSMGTFHVDADGRADIRMPVAVDVRRFQLVDVSLEPDDGDPAHSTTSVLRAAIPRRL